MRNRTKLAVVALAALVIAVAACSSQAPSVDHYPTFSKAMDKLAGPGKWSAKGHTNGPDDLLTVTGLTIKLPGLAVPGEMPVTDEPVRTGDDGTAQVVKVSGERQVDIATVEIKKILDQKTLETLLAAADWRDQKELRLADSIVMKGITHKMPLGKDVFEYTVEEAAVKSAVLAAAGPEAPAGRPGFLKALRLGSMSYKNFKMNGQSKDSQMTATVALAAIDGLAFDGEIFAGFDRMDPSGLTGVMSSMSANSISLKDMVMDIKDPQGKFSGRMTLASVEEKDVKAMRSISELSIDGFKFDLTDEHKRASNFGLAKINLRGLDMSAYMTRMMPIMIAAAANPEQADQLVASLYTIGDIFVSPFSLDEVSLSGLDVNVAGLFAVKLAEAKVAGPYQAGQIPTSQKSSFKGLEIILPEDAKAVADDEDLKAVYDFGQQFGMTRFVIEGDSEGVYDPKTGLVSNRLNRFSVKDLMDITASGEMAGLTPERLEKLNSTPLSMITLALMAPDAVFGDLAINKFNLKIEDKGLTDRSLAFAALAASEDTGSKLSADDIRQQVLAMLPLLIKMQGSQYLGNADVLSDSLTAFFKKPGSLELKLAADPPLGVKSFMSMDHNQILNSLNLSLSANGEQAPALKFNIPD